MSEHHPHATAASPQPHAPEMPFRLIITSALCLIVLTGAVLLGMHWLFTAATARRARLDAPPAPMAQTASPLPPEPRLQVRPAQDLQQVRAEEDAILHSYGWVEHSTDTVRIPIERAMELLATRGLPSRPAAPPGSKAERQETP